MPANDGNGGVGTGGVEQQPVSQERGLPQAVSGGGAGHSLDQVTPHRITTSALIVDYLQIKQVFLGSYSNCSPRSL